MRIAKSWVIFGLIAVSVLTLLLILKAEKAPYDFLQGHRASTVETSGTTVYHIEADYQPFRRIVAKELRARGAKKKIPTAWDTWILPDSQLWVMEGIVNIQQGPTWEEQHFRTEPGMISVVIYRPAQMSFWDKVRAFLHI